MAENLPLYTDDLCMRKQVIADCVVQEIGMDIGIEPWEHGNSHLDYYLATTNSYKIFEDINQMCIRDRHIPMYRQNTADIV